MDKEVMKAVVEMIKAGGDSAVSIIIWLKVAEFTMALIKFGCLFGIAYMFFASIKYGINKNNQIKNLENKKEK